ncbi:MAG: oligosaccharide flippase family protein [Balneolaceae bacterium]
MRKLKELFSDTLIYGVSSVFARFINYLLVPLYTGVFDPDAYGIVGLVYAAVGFLNVVFTMGMESSYIRYGKDREKAPSYFKTLQLFLLGSSGVLVLFLFLLQPILSPLLGLEIGGDSIFLIMLGILFFDTLSIVPFAELRLSQKAWLFASLKTLNVLINIGLNFYLILGLEYGIEAVFISNLVASIVTALLVWLITLPMLSGSLDKDILQKALVFGLPFIPAGIGHAINETLDRFFLKGMSESSITSIYGEALTSDYIVGVYNACYKLAVFMLLLVQMFRMAWQPFFMRQSDQKDAPELFAQTFTFFNIAAAILFLMVSLFLPQIVSIKIPFLDAYLIGEEYWMGLSIVPILLLAYWFQGWYVNFSAGIFIAEKTKKLAQITLIGASVTIIINLILIPLYGMMGSALATLASYLIMAMLIYRYSTQSFKVPYKLWQGFAVVGVAAITIFAKSFLSDQFFSDIAASIIAFVAGIVLISLLSFRDLLAIKRDS